MNIHTKNIPQPLNHKKIHMNDHLRFQKGTKKIKCLRFYTQIEIVKKNE